MSQALQGVVQMMRQTSDDEREERQYLIEYSPHQVIRLDIPRNRFHQHVASLSTAVSRPFPNRLEVDRTIRRDMTLQAGRMGGSCFFHRMVTFGEAPKCHGTDMQRPGAPL